MIRLGGFQMVTNEYSYLCERCQNRQRALIVSYNPTLCAVCKAKETNPDYPYSLEEVTKKD